VCELERLVVREWQLYNSSGTFDATMAHHIANTLIDFAKELGRPAAGLLQSLSEEDAAKFQMMLAAKGGASGAGNEIRELLVLLQGAAKRKEEEGGAAGQPGDADAVAAPPAAPAAPDVADGKDAGHQAMVPAGAAAAAAWQDEKEEEGEQDEEQEEGAAAEVSAEANDTSRLSVSRLPDLDLVMQLLERDGSGRRLVFSTWDYGGQHVFRIVHHLFLTRFAVYLAVFNMADLVGAEATEATADKCLNELHGWLNDLWMHAAEAPVIVVGTHKDTIDNSPSTLKHVDGLLRNRFAGTKFWPFLRSNDVEGLGFFGVDSKSRAGDEGGADPTVALLRQKVEELAKGEKYIDKQLPMKWLLVLDMVEAMTRGETQAQEQEGKGEQQQQQQQQGGERAAPVRRVSLSRMHAIGKECGLPSDPSLSLEEEVGALLDLFHELGMLVHYNDPKLR
jgi:GTPase SAR1 family protein